MRFVGGVVFEINRVGARGGSRGLSGPASVENSPGCPTAQHSNTKRQTWSALSYSRIPFHRQHPWNRLEKTFVSQDSVSSLTDFWDILRFDLLWMKNGDHEDRAGALQRPGSIRDRRQRSTLWSSSSNIVMLIEIFSCWSQYSDADHNILMLISIFWCWSQHSDADHHQVDQKASSRGLCGCFPLLQWGPWRCRQWGLWVADHYCYCLFL